MVSKENTQAEPLIAPLIALAWPEKNSVELNQLYEALTVLLVEEFDLLILTAEAQQLRIQERLLALDVSEENIHFMHCDANDLDVSRRFILQVIRNPDGSETIDLSSIDINGNPKIENSKSENEYLIAQNKIFVPVYDESIHDEILMEISQKFPQQEVIALNCESLKPLNLKFSELFLFPNK